MKFLSKLFLVCLIGYSGVVLAGKVNINTAPAEVLAAELVGIGLSKAQAIVSYRTHNGAFKSADELAEVKGVGEKTVEKNREFILVKAD
jgi:competence protein ComEA